MARSLITVMQDTCKVQVLVGQPKPNNLAVTAPNPVLSTGFDGSETRVPSGYTKGLRLLTSAFLCSIASLGKNFEHRQSAQSLALGAWHHSGSASSRGVSRSFAPKALGCLWVSRRLGYRVLRALNPSQPHLVVSGRFEYTNDREHGTQRIRRAVVNRSLRERDELRSL